MKFRNLLIPLIAFHSLVITADTIQKAFGELDEQHWLTWQISIESNRGWYCWGHNYSKYSEGDSNRLTLYWRANEFNMASDNCTVDITEPVTALSSVDLEQSVRFIRHQLDAKQWTASEKDKMLHALALHRHPSAFNALATYFAAGATNKQQELINLFMTTHWHQEGFDFVARQLNDKVDIKREKKLLFALSQSPIDEARGLVYQRAKQAQSRAVRKEAIFWYSQFKHSGIAEDLVKLLASEGDRKLAEHIVFAISQAKDGQGLDILSDLIRTSDDSHIRQKALFWLAHSDEDRAMPILEELLSAK